MRPEAAHTWTTATQDERWNKFRPGAIRKRLSSWGQDTSAVEADYEGHSMSLHPSPIRAPFLLRGIQNHDNGAFGFDMGFWEMFQHAHRLLGAVASYADALDKPEVAALARRDNPDFARGCAATYQMQTMFIIMLQAATKGAASETPADS